MTSTVASIVLTQTPENALGALWIMLNPRGLGHLAAPLYAAVLEKVRTLRDPASRSGPGDGMATKKARVDTTTLSRVELFDDLVVEIVKAMGNGPAVGRLALTAPAKLKLVSDLVNDNLDAVSSNNANQGNFGTTRPFAPFKRLRQSIVRDAALVCTICQSKFTDARALLMWTLGNQPGKKVATSSSKNYIDYIFSFFPGPVYGGNLWEKIRPGLTAPLILAQYNALSPVSFLRWFRGPQFFDPTTQLTDAVLLSANQPAPVPPVLQRQGASGLRDLYDFVNEWLNLLDASWGGDGEYRKPSEANDDDDNAIVIEELTPVNAVYVLAKSMCQLLAHLIAIDTFAKSHKTRSYSQIESKRQEVVRDGYGFGKTFFGPFDDAHSGWKDFDRILASFDKKPSMFKAEKPAPLRGKAPFLKETEVLRKLFNHPNFPRHLDADLLTPLERKIVESVEVIKNQIWQWYVNNTAYASLAGKLQQQYRPSLVVFDIAFQRKFGAGRHYEPSQYFAERFMDDKYLSWSLSDILKSDNPVESAEFASLTTDEDKFFVEYELLTSSFNIQEGSNFIFKNFLKDYVEWTDKK